MPREKKKKNMKQVVEPNQLKVSSHEPQLHNNYYELYTFVLQWLPRLLSCTASIKHLLGKLKKIKSDDFQHVEPSVIL